MQFSDLTITYMLNKASVNRSAALTSLSGLLQDPSAASKDSNDDLHKRIDDALDKLVHAEMEMQTIHKYFVNNQAPQNDQQNPQASPVHFEESDFKSAQTEDKPNYTLKL